MNNRERLKQAIDNMEKTDVCLEIFDRTFDQARETLRAIIHAAGSRDGVGAKEIFQAREALAAMEATHDK